MIRRVATVVTSCGLVLMLVGGAAAQQQPANPTAPSADDGAPTVVITGTVGSEEARGRVLEIARRVAPTATIVDRLELAPPDPRITR